MTITRKLFEKLARKRSIGPIPRGDPPDKEPCSILFINRKSNPPTARETKLECCIDETDRFMLADMTLGMIAQSVDSREQFLEYAQREGYTWALSDFLDRHGWLDDDWEERLALIEDADDGSSA